MINKILALMERIQQLCPSECQIETVLTGQKEVKCLVVIKFPLADVAHTALKENIAKYNNERFETLFKRDPILKMVYFWEKLKIHRLHYGKILPLLNNSRRIRVLYFCGRQFVFYPHTFRCLTNCKDVINYMGVKLKKHNDYKYIGICKDSEKLIDYLRSNSDI